MAVPPASTRQRSKKGADRGVAREPGRPVRSAALFAADHQIGEPHRHPGHVGRDLPAEPFDRRPAFFDRTHRAAGLLDVKPFGRTARLADDLVDLFGLGVFAAEAHGEHGAHVGMAGQRRRGGRMA